MKVECDTIKIALFMDQNAFIFRQNKQLKQVAFHTVENILSLHNKERSKL